MDYLRRADIHLELLAACKVVLCEPHRVKTYDEVDLWEECSVYVDKPDDFILPDRGLEPMRWPNQVFLRDLEELEFAITFILKMNADEISHFDSLDLQDTLAHESAHAKAAKDLGFSNVFFSLIVEKCVPKQRFWSMSYTTETYGQTLPVSKLGDVAISLAPKKPSNSDIGHAIAMGYESVSQVGRRIIAHNSDPDNQQLPVPGGFDVTQHFGDSFTL